MKSNIDKYKADLEELLDQGRKLHTAFQMKHAEKEVTNQIIEKLGAALPKARVKAQP
jgi:hypothetical protein